MVINCFKSKTETETDKIELLFIVTKQFGPLERKLLLSKRVNSITSKLMPAVNGYEAHVILIPWFQPMFFQAGMYLEIKKDTDKRENFARQSVLAPFQRDCLWTQVLVFAVVGFFFSWISNHQTGQIRQILWANRILTNSILKTIVCFAFKDFSLFL